MIAPNLFWVIAFPLRIRGISVPLPAESHINIELWDLFGQRLKRKSVRQQNDKETFLVPVTIIQETKENSRISGMIRIMKLDHVVLLCQSYG